MSSESKNKHEILIKESSIFVSYSSMDKENVSEIVYMIENNFKLVAEEVEIRPCRLIAAIPANFWNV